MGGNAEMMFELHCTSSVHVGTSMKIEESGLLVSAADGLPVEGAVRRCWFVPVVGAGGEFLLGGILS